MKTTKNILYFIAGLIKTIILYLVYILDKIITLPITKAIPNFTTFAFHEYGRKHKQNSMIRVITLFFVYLITKLF